jgi:hypothetical protein
MSLNPDQLNVIALDEVRELCKEVEKKKVGGMSFFASAEDREEMRFHLDGQQYLANQILRLIGRG